MNRRKRNPAVPVGSSEINQGPTTSPRAHMTPAGRGDVLQNATTQPKSSQKITTLHAATYNVRTLSDNNHLTILEKELENINWDILGISEMRRPGEAVVQLPNGHILYNNGNDRKQGGVGFLIKKELEGNVECFK